MLLGQKKRNLTGLQYKDGNSYEEVMKYPARLITINGVTKEPIFRYLGGYSRGCSLEEWLPDKYGETLPASGSVPPTIHRRSTKMDTGTSAAVYHAGNTSFADIENEDIVFEIILKRGAVVSPVSKVVSKWTNGVGSWEFVFYGSGLKSPVFWITDGTNDASIEAAELPEDIWTHILVFLDRSGSASVYIDGSHSNTSIISAVGSLTSNTSDFYVGGDTAGTYKTTAGIAYISMWKGDNWLDSDLQTLLAEERYNQTNLRQFVQQQKDVVVNGDFDDGTTGWSTQNSPIISIHTENNNKYARVTCPDPATYFPRLYQNPLTVGKTYRATGKVRLSASGVSAYFFIGAKSFRILTATTSWTTFDFQCKTTQVHIYLIVSGSPDDYTEWDDIVIRELEDI